MGRMMYEKKSMLKDEFHLAIRKLIKKHNTQFKVNDELVRGTFTIKNVRGYLLFEGSGVIGYEVDLIFKGSIYHTGLLLIKGMGIVNHKKYLSLRPRNKSWCIRHLERLCIGICKHHLPIYGIPNHSGAAINVIWEKG